MNERMGRNIEIKARIADLQRVLTKAADIADEGPFELHQDDTFFRCEIGRLKLRVLSESSGELIFYQRSDQPGPKESSYSIYATSSPQMLRDVLASAYGQVGSVRKHRTLFLAGRTRVHLDRVEGLGDFLELEVVLREGETVEAGVREAHSLMEQLGVRPDQFVARAYIDLLIASD